jgi:hypothetical protein
MGDLPPRMLEPSLEHGQMVGLFIQSFYILHSPVQMPASLPRCVCTYMQATALRVEDKRPALAPHH